MTYEAFLNEYKPQQNHLCEGAPYGGIMYETLGEEFDYVKKFIMSDKRRRVWTIVDDNGKDIIIAGYHFINRLGYVITEKEWEENYDFVRFE
jgi:hypothetical protein